MSLTNVEVMKETIGLASYEDEWIHNSMVSTSPFGDFIVISSSTNAVFYIKKFMAIPQQEKRELKMTETIKSKPYFQILRTYSPICDTSGDITAVKYLPIKVVSSSGRAHDMWHCVVIGYESGLVEVVAADSGNVLLSKQFSKPNGDTSNFCVTSIQYLASSLMLNGTVSGRSNSYQTKTLAIPRLQELIIVMKSTLAVIDSSSLFSTLLKSRNDISANRTNGLESTVKLPVVPFKRFKVKDQSRIIDAVAYSQPNIPLDQYHHISMNKELLNEEHLRTLKNVTTYVTVGSSPFIQHNCPHQLGPQNINELAANVVSTVKSGLFRAATGFIGSWAGVNTENEEPANQPDPEHYLHIRHAFKDNSKNAVCIRISPDGKYSAILDEHNRIMLLDNGANSNGGGSGTVIHVWKGYHHAQIGWITTSWEDRKCDRSDKVPQDLEVSVLLVLYLPRRGLLEVWSPEQMYRVVEFTVGKHGRLISCSNALLDENSISSPLSVRTISECTFLEPSGVIRHIYIPINSLTTKSSSHDTVIRKQLFSLALEENQNKDENSNSGSDSAKQKERTRKITALILSAKSTMGKIEMLIELFQIWKVVGTTNQKIVLEAVTSQLSESEVASQRCKILQTLVDFYDFLVTTCDDSDKSIEQNKSPNMTKELITEKFSCSSKEADDALNIFRLCRQKNFESQLKDSYPTFYFSHFISCFDLKYSSFGESDNRITKAFKINLKAKCNSIEMLSLCRLIAKSSFIDPDGTTNIMKSNKIANGYELISNFFSNAIRYCDMREESKTIEWIENTLNSTSFRAYCNLSFELHETNGDGSSFQTLIQCARLILVRNHPISFSSYCVALAWKSFLSNGVQHDGQKKFQSYVAEWQHAMFLMEGFLTIARTANESLGLYDLDSGDNHKYTLQNVFNSGDGNISELFIRWMLDRGVRLQNILSIEEPLACNDNASANNDTQITKMEVDIEERSDEINSSSIDFDVRKFLEACKEFFPMSSRKEILVCHMAWEYLHRWSLNHKNLTLITEGAIPCLQNISQPSIQHRISSLCWTTFVSKITIEAVNLTENRSATRCEREIGLQESDLSIFLSAAASLLRILVNTSEVEANISDLEKLRYDEVSLTGNVAGGHMYQKFHLMDHIREKCRSSDTDAIAIQYQFVTVANVIWNFGIDSIKPLSLFNSQESNLYFQGSESSSTFISSGTFQSLSMFQGDHSRSVRQQRRRFLDAACDGAVACIQNISNGQIDCKDYERWCSILIMLGKMWHMAEKLREIQITSLYRGGHDNLGAELINLLPDRSVIAHKLLHVSLLRLSKYIYLGGVDGVGGPQAEAKAKIAALASTNSNLAKQLETLKKEATKNLPGNSSLKDTSDLLVMLSGFDLEEQSQQLAYECLALTQSLRS